jgi:hypothetical protein
LRISIPYTYLNPYDHVWLRFWCRFRTKLIVGRAKRFASVRRLVAALIHFYMKSVTSQTWVKPCFLPLLGSSACLLLCSSLLSITPLRSFLFFFLPTAPARPPVYRDLISAAPSFRLEGSRGEQDMDVVGDVGAGPTRGRLLGSSSTQVLILIYPAYHEQEQKHQRVTSAKHLA